MQRGRGISRRQDQVRGPESRVRRAPREVQQPQPVVRNVGRRPLADVEQEAYIERRLRVNEPELVAMRPVDIRVNEPHLAALGEVNEVYDEPLTLPGFNEVDIFIAKNLRTKFGILNTLICLLYIVRILTAKQIMKTQLASMRILSKEASWIGQNVT
ncbi:Hypothetical predicted protein [Mytilus galloprovincialis]|uniref:Uncharacterized protein n=1 Tax=Mytilus galloprovincialis TaxID=29158 RepID=A0A8B6GG30_MYTGA|nr:Hypothetical predicted protein [Mytilus galloprovincialis]